MKTYDLYDRILGGLVMSGIGDALGAPAEGFSQREIEEEFGRLEGFVDASANEIFKAHHAAEITGNSSQLVETVKAAVDAGGKLTVADAAGALVRWSDNWPEHYSCCADETTKEAAAALKAGADPYTTGKTGKLWGRGTSNGAAVRAAAAGLLHPGDPDSAAQSAAVIAAPSHGTQHAYSGACAVACAVSAALAEGADVWKVLRAALDGARRGRQAGLREGRAALGPDTLERMADALTQALLPDTVPQLERALNELLGDETCSALGAAAGVLALFAAAGGDPVKAVNSSVNFGGDTSALGFLSGMLAGALGGCSALPQGLCSEFRKRNPRVSYEKLAQDLVCISRTAAPAT